jgi:hypothetical protein
MIAVTLALALAFAPAPAAGDIGPEPTAEAFAALAEAELLRKLKKPQQLSFEWPYRLVAGPAGYYTCGRARNAGKPRSPQVWVTALVARGQLVSARWANPGAMLEYDCKQQVKKGVLVAR